MTEDDKALVERLLRRTDVTAPYANDIVAQAATRIEALSAENERLREALRQIANIIPPIQTTIARAALGDTK